MYLMKRDDLCRFISLILLITSLFAFFALNSEKTNAALSCTITTSCTNTCVFKIYPTENGHAELCSGTNYSNVICCSAPGETLTTGTGTEILNLASSTNAHVELPSYTNFLNKIYLGSQGRNVACEYKTTCSADETCLASIASSANAHIASCNYFSTNICCKTVSAPITVTLQRPSNNNLTVFARRPLFEWASSSTGVTYEINITHGSCSNIFQSGIAVLNFTPSQDLCTDSLYSWKVRAYDGIDYHQWSNSWSFIIESAVIVNLTANSTDFGMKDLNATDDTLDGVPQPLVVSNIGNVLVDISVRATSLWSSKSLDTHYFQFSAGEEPTAPGAFNFALSQTQWANLSLTEKNVIRQLNFNQSNLARIHLGITVPIDEAPGARTSTIYISGAMS
ncbi:MAG TPA: hypothetical protein VI894_03255 [Candidatus Nanoarchaeia archaeon]|nr:hypothetical protein [Candidatus Nanoarchaeia archaeon]